MKKQRILLAGLAAAAVAAACDGVAPTPTEPTLQPRLDVGGGGYGPGNVTGGGVLMDGGGRVGCDSLCAPGDSVKGGFIGSGG